MTEQNIDLHDITGRFVEAFNRHDLDVVMSFFTDDAWFEDGLGNIFEGKEAIRAALSPLLSGARGQIKFRGEDYFANAEKNKVMTSWSLEMDVNNSRKKMRGLDLLLFKGDKIARKSAYCKGSGYRLDDV